MSSQAQVFDASALLLYLEKEPGYEKVQRALTEAATGAPILMNAVNWGEVRYILLREYGNAECARILNLIDTFPIEVVAVEKQLAAVAGDFKIKNGLGYADAFAAASAKASGGRLFTGDRGFKAVENIVQITWL